MPRQYTKIVPLDDMPVATFQEGEPPLGIVRYAEVRLWVEEPNRYIYDPESLRQWCVPTGRQEVLPNPWRDLSWGQRLDLGLAIRQPKTLTFDVWTVHETVNRTVIWTDEILGQQFQRETVDREYEWLVPEGSDLNTRAARPYKPFQA